MVELRPTPRLGSSHFFLKVKDTLQPLVVFVVFSPACGWYGAASHGPNKSIPRSFLQGLAFDPIATRNRWVGRPVS